jgi:signal transduction histidine kinase/DNA-binding response OmpR family regulator
MQPLLYLAEIIFFVLFVATLAEFLRRRDPVSRDVMLSFSALAVLFVVSLWQDLGGAAPDFVRAIGGGFFILQPVFVLHLVSLIRRVPAPLYWGGTILLAATGLPLVVLQIRAPILTVLVAIAFIGMQAAAAGYLLLEARRRTGPGAARMVLAAASTSVFAAALLVSVAGTVAAQTEAGQVVGTVLSIVAGLGYLFAFVPPAPIRAIWQAQTTVDYTRTLIAQSREPVAAIWKAFTEMAVRMQGGAAIMITGIRPGEPSIVASSGFEGDAGAVQVGWPELEVLVQAGRARPDAHVDQVGPIRQQLAERAGARFVSVVPVALPDRWESAALVLLSPHRSLFHASDLELLSALGAQTAIVAERRAVMAEQEDLTERLKLTVEALRSASAAKSDFVASMSHEFRTPLSAILGFSELMGGEPRDGDTVRVPVEWVEHMHRGGQHLLALVNDVLDLARVEAGRLELRPEPIDVGSAVTEAINGLRPLADRKTISIDAFVPSMTVTADRGRFRQILYNLISNAIKYTPDGGTIRVAATQQGDEIRVAVTDNGVGIDPQDHERVFEEFRQVGDPEDRQPGTGLGLAVTRRLAEAHEGRVELVSARGKGSTFTLVLPAPVAGRDAVAPEPASAAEIGRAVGAGIDSGDVLVIEDDPSAVRLLREYLEAAGYSVRVAATGESGLAAVAERAPAAIVLDVLLPGIDGWEVLRRLRGNDRTQAIPVIIVTVVEEREVGLALGAADYLVKPIHRAALLGCLARYVANGSGAARARRVLVIDDEASALSLIRAALEPEGYEVVTAQGGRAALEWARRGQHVDLVVCDLVMPEIDGFEVIAALKRERRTSAVPIVVCTAHDLSVEQKARLNGQILGIVAKGQDARLGLLDWLSRSAPSRPN